MPFINLIEEQRQEARRAEGKTRVAFLSFAATTVICLGGFGFLLFRNDVLGSELAKVQADAKKVEPMARRIKESEDILSELAPKLKTLENAQLLTARWDRILTHLSKNTPSPMWLTDMRASFSDPTKPVQTTFIGLCDKLEPVGEFILRLQSCPDLEGVNLKVAQEKQVAQGKGIEFEVDANVAGTVEVEPKKSAKKSGGSA